MSLMTLIWPWYVALQTHSSFTKKQVTSCNTDFFLSLFSFGTRICAERCFPVMFPSISFYSLPWNSSWHQCVSPNLRTWHFEPAKIHLTFTPIITFSVAIFYMCVLSLSATLFLSLSFPFFLLRRSISHSGIIGSSRCHVMRSGDMHRFHKISQI